MGMEWTPASPGDSWHLPLPLSFCPAVVHWRVSLEQPMPEAPHRQEDVSEVSMSEVSGL